ERADSSLTKRNRQPSAARIPTIVNEPPSAPISTMTSTASTRSGRGASSANVMKNPQHARTPEARSAQYGNAMFAYKEKQRFGFWGHKRWGRPNSPPRCPLARDARTHAPLLPLPERRPPEGQASLLTCRQLRFLLEASHPRRPKEIRPPPR